MGRITPSHKQGFNVLYADGSAKFYIRAKEFDDVLFALPTNAFSLPGNNEQDKMWWLYDR